MDYLPPLPDPATDTIRRYVIVTPRPESPRYLNLLGGRPQDGPLLRALRHDARHISDAELTFLLHLDGRLGSVHAERYLAPDGSWQHWATAVSNPPDVNVYHDRIARLCTL